MTREDKIREWEAELAGIPEAMKKAANEGDQTRMTFLADRKRQIPKLIEALQANRIPGGVEASKDNQSKGESKEMSVVTSGDMLKKASDKAMGRVAPAVNEEGIANNPADHVLGLELELAGIPARIALAEELGDHEKTLVLADRRRELPRLMGELRLRRLLPENCPILDSQADRVAALEAELRRLPELLQDAGGNGRRMQEIAARMEALPGIIERAKAPGDAWRTLTPIFLHTRDQLIRAMQGELRRIDYLLRRTGGNDGLVINLMDRRERLPGIIKQIQRPDYQLWYTWPIKF